MVVIHITDVHREGQSILESLFCFQSLTLPLQGFFNAIVYGWTKQNFVDVVVDKHTLDENAALIHTFPVDVDQSINNEEEGDRGHVKGTESALGLLRNGQSVTMSSSLENRAGDITDCLETELSDTEEESSLDRYATLSVHKEKV